MTLLKIVSALVLLYIAVAVFLYFTQRSQIYFPDKSRPVLPNGADVVEVTTSDGVELEGWYFAPSDMDKPILLYFHGNGGHYGGRLPKVQDYIDAGYGVLLAEYRGYGGNEGSPSEVGFYEDGHAYIRWLEIAAGYPISDIILYGESIGSGTATEMATKYDVKALILEAPFSSLLEMVQRHVLFMPFFWLLKDRYLNIDKIDRINAPLLVMHGRKDSVIPYKFAEKLYAKAKEPKKFVDFPDANHNNLYEYGASQDVLEFLENLK